MVFIHVHVVVKLSIIQLDSFLLDLIERMCGSVEISSYFIKQMHEIKCCSYILVKKKSMLFYIRLMALHRKCQKSIALNVAITDVCCCIKNLNNKTYSCAEVVFIFDKLIQNSS